MSERCECVTFWRSGDIRRCASMKSKNSEFCYHHAKYFNEAIKDYYPAPMDWKYSDWDEENGDYIEKVTNVDGDKVRRFDYRLHKPAPMYNPTVTL